tara:strand:+ start:456 stop:1754 length:1299 start_codon:yes stop_codon:yes gene_type:complete
MFLTFICIALLATVCTSANSQSNLYPIQLSAGSIHTIQLHPVGQPATHPFIPLEGGQLLFSFDDFSPEYRTLEVRFKHCTFDWYDSPDLLPSDYITGFSSAAFETVQTSFNTKTSFTHYSATFPDEMIRFTRSGNYIAEVYDTSNPDRALIQKRFVIYESLVDIQMRVRPSSIVRKKRTHQEVDLAIQYSFDSYPIYDAYDALRVVLMQNGRWETAILGLQPQFVRGEEVTFNPTGSQSFAGGNTWRFADLKSLQFASLGINRIIDEGAHWHVHLDQDEPRTYAFLKSQQDLDGHFVISNELQDDATGSDYVWTHFSVKAFEERLQEDVYVYGGLSDWSYPESHRMIWNSETNNYEASIFLKQGYYNYEYRVRPKLDRGKLDYSSLKEQPSDINAIEGSHALADTPYMCMVYYWDLDGFDRVIGFTSVKPSD